MQPFTEQTGNAQDLRVVQRVTDHEVVLPGRVHIIGNTALNYPRADEEQNSMEEYNVQEVPAMGFGNPDAKISYAKQKAENRLSDEVESAAVEIIQAGSAMGEITDKDDGCMDGRGAKWVTFANALGIFGEKATTAAKHLRAKLAGGGYLTALSMKIALDSHVGDVDEELREVTVTLADQGIICGTHKGDHENEEKTDCGANDNLKTIFINGFNHFGAITKTIKTIYTLRGIAYDESADNRVHAGWSGTLEQQGYFAGSNGVSRYKVIMGHIAREQQKDGGEYPVSTSKHLRGGHNEAFVVLNFCEGKTFSQAAFKEQLQARFPDTPEEELPQVFVVDVSRILTLAEAMSKGREDEKGHSGVALFAGISYQFATAATLTDGSLRTFIVSEK
ncbi:hypothetical protein IPL68_06415 [Candidatus Saccharibacteria bacterium]|nr:MAG: hypothetical protein IPL68_06415 [Candidatus Saccharibacteria bacterium]